MSNNKRISFNKFTGFINEHKLKEITLTYTTTNGENFEVAVKPRLDLSEMAILVNSVVSEVFNTSTNHYNPEIYDLILRREVVSAYTNVTIPDDLNKMVDLLYNTDLFERITERDDGEGVERLGVIYEGNPIIDVRQYDFIIKAIDDKTTFKINEYLKKSKLDDLLDALTKMVSDTEGQFKDIDLKSVLGQLSNLSNMNQEALAKAVVENISQPESKIIEFPAAMDGE